MHRFTRRRWLPLAGPLATTVLLATVFAASAHADGRRFFARPGAAQPFLVVNDQRSAAAAAGSRSPPQPRSARAELERLVPSARGLELVSLPDGDIVVDAETRLVHYEQRFLGVPVLGRGATVRLDAKGRASLASASLETKLPRDATPTVAPHAAADAAGKVVRVPIDASFANLAIAPFAEGGVLVWRFEPRVSGVPFAPQILVDARTGAVRVARDRAVDFEPPRARVYASNPFKSAGLELLPFAIPPEEGRLSSERIVAKTCVDNGKVQAFPGVPSGIRVCDLVSIATPGASGDYDSAPIDDVASANRNEDAFAEASMYYHLGRVYSFFEALAPPKTKRIVASKPFTAIANLRLAPGLGSGDDTHLGDPKAPLAPYSNAFYAPGGDGFGSLYGIATGALWFGQGPRRDYAYDGDVVYHEFTHAIVDGTLQLGTYAFDDQGLSAAPGALNEALADLFSSALAGDPDVGEYASSDLNESQRFVRTLANDDRCPTRFVGEVHFDSTAFSGGMWAARSTLSPLERVVFDRALYEALLTNPRFDSPTFGEFIAVLLETFRLRSSLGARAIETELAARGLWPECERVLEASDRTVTAPADTVGRLGFQSPGTLETGVALVPGVVSFRSAVSPTPGRLSVRFVGRSRSAGTNLLRDSAGTPFAPTVLARFDSPIRYEGSVHNATASVPAKAEGAQWTAEIPIPQGAKTVYVQIANAGDTSGVYDGVRLSVVAAAPDAGADTGERGTPTLDQAPSRCSVTNVGFDDRRNSGGTAPRAWLGGLGLALSFRRRWSCKKRL